MKVLLIFFFSMKLKEMVINTELDATGFVFFVQSFEPVMIFLGFLF